METAAILRPARLPRFRRATEPPAFRLTDNDLDILRHLARHRFLRSRDIAELIGRSVDRTNHRLSGLFHHGYVDRPRAQFDFLAATGSAAFVYALADRGARLVVAQGEHERIEWGRKNARAGRPFIEHQLAIVDFQLALRRAVQAQRDVRLISQDELIASFPTRCKTSRNPLSLRAAFNEKGRRQEISVIPDLAFSVVLGTGERRNFLVEIDRGTMPIVRRDLSQTSFERKMRSYLAAYGSGAHRYAFGWTSFRVLTVTTSALRMDAMIKALTRLKGPPGLGSSLFLFSHYAELDATDPLAFAWLSDKGRRLSLAASAVS